MKRQLATICILVVFVCTLYFSGCSDSDPTIYRKELKSIEQVGQIPDEFQPVIENNLLYNVTAFEDRLLKAKVCSVDEENKRVVHQVCMLDVYGNELAAYTCSSDDAYHVGTLTATEDGGFLFVLGFLDYAYDQNTWASDYGFASRVIKCDSNGILQFDTSLDGIDENALEYCFEKNGCFYLFGNIETPETKIRGVGSSTDIYMVILDASGKVLKSRCIAGSDFDDLKAVEVFRDDFILSISSQSNDGDFTCLKFDLYPDDWVVRVNDELEITKKQKKSGRDSVDYRLGVKDGIVVYRRDDLLNGFDAGYPDALIDYGDSYLIVSENNTGIYENTPPMISSIWYYTETVYSMYDNHGELLFRASVDSSPDYDAWVKEWAIQ